MAAPPLMRSLSTKAEQNKKLQRPRPLRTSSSQNRLSADLSSQAGHFQDLMNLVESVSVNLFDQNYGDMLTSSISVMSSKLKQNGSLLESIYKDQLDRAFHIFRDGCQDESLQCTSRLHLLELVELRANHWSDCDKTQIYYSGKMAASEIEPAATTPDANPTTIPMSTPSPPAPPVLGPGEVLKTSGKFTKPTKIPGKNYCKDEVVIRNSDSGKVMGIKGRRVHMIEELSETIISFQRADGGVDNSNDSSASWDRSHASSNVTFFKDGYEYMRPVIIKSPVVWNTARYLYPPHFFRPSYPSVYMGPPRPGYMVNPGAKERLVQITGPSEDKINHARQLMEDTIRRNASPIREGSERERIGDSNSSLNSSASDESGRLTHQGSRRSLLHSFSTNDASIGEYKYTVTLGHDTVKITGTNHEAVRNARLVLEEYYNVWLQKNCIGDCYGLEEDVFLDPVAQDMSVLRLNSLDSGNGNHQVSSSSGDSDDVTCISSVTPPVTGLEPGLAYQPIYPGGPIDRRPSFRRSNSIPLSPQAVETAHTRKYSREFLLSCAVSQLSRATPHDWDAVVERFPAIVKKASPPFDPMLFLPRPESSAIISSTQLANEPDSD